MVVISLLRFLQNSHLRRESREMQKKKTGRIRYLRRFSFSMTAW